MGNKLSQNPLRTTDICIGQLSAIPKKIIRRKKRFALTRCQLAHCFWACGDAAHHHASTQQRKPSQQEVKEEKKGGSVQLPRPLGAHTADPEDLLSALSL